VDGVSSKDDKAKSARKDTQPRKKQRIPNPGGPASHGSLGKKKRKGHTTEYPGIDPNAAHKGTPGPKATHSRKRGRSPTRFGDLLDLAGATKEQATSYCTVCSAMCHADVRLKPCGHLLSLACLKKWLLSRRRRAVCPTCIKPFEPGKDMENVDKESRRRVWITSDERKYGGHVRKLDAEKAQHEGDYVWMYACTYTYTYTYPLPASFLPYPLRLLPQNSKRISL
jgi:hypothetical protein